MGTTRARSILLCVAASTALAGCSVGSNDGSDPAEGPSEAPLAAQERSFTVAVLERRGAASLPVRGATVILDKPGGIRVTATTAADGRAHFSDVDWGRGEAALTILERDHVMRSLVGLSAADVLVRSGVQPRAVADTRAPRDITCFVARTVAAERATLSGQILNKQAASHFVTLSASVEAGSYQSTRASYSLDVERDRPFSVLGLEWAPTTPTTVSKRGIEQTFYRWTRWDRSALTGDATASLDFAGGARLAPVRTRGRIAIPGASGGALGAATKGYGTVGTGSAAVLGGTTRSDLAADGDSFEFEMEHVVLDGIGVVGTDFVIARDDGAVSYIQRSGYPNDGEVIDGFLIPPDPAPGVQPLFGEVAFRGLPATSSPRLLVRDGFGTVKWVVDGPAGRTAIKAPSLDTAGLHELGNADRLRLVALEGYDAETGEFSHVATSREMSLAR